MRYFIIFMLFIIINPNNYSQIKNNEKHQAQYLKSYLKFGFGKMDDYINFGAGLFFPVSGKFMLGIRGNVNSEIDVLKFKYIFT